MFNAHFLIEFFTKVNFNALKGTDIQLKYIVQIRFIKLSKRLLTKEEEDIIISHLNDKTSNKIIAGVLICRTVIDIQKRRKFLKKNFNNKK